MRHYYFDGEMAALQHQSILNEREGEGARCCKDSIPKGGLFGAEGILKIRNLLVVKLELCQSKGRRLRHIESTVRRNDLPDFYSTSLRHTLPWYRQEDPRVRV